MIRNEQTGQFGIISKSNEFVSIDFLLDTLLGGNTIEYTETVCDINCGDFYDVIRDIKNYFTKADDSKTISTCLSKEEHFQYSLGDITYYKKTINDKSMDEYFKKGNSNKQYKYYPGLLEIAKTMTWGDMLEYFDKNDINYTPIDDITKFDDFKNVIYFGFSRDGEMWEILRDTPTAIPLHIDMYDNDDYGYHDLEAIKHHMETKYSSNFKDLRISITHYNPPHLTGKVTLSQDQLDKAYTFYSKNEYPYHRVKELFSYAYVPKLDFFELGQFHDKK